MRLELFNFRGVNINQESILGSKFLPYPASQLMSKEKKQRAILLNGTF